MIGLEEGTEMKNIYVANHKYTEKKYIYTHTYIYVTHRVI